MLVMFSALIRALLQCITQEDASLTSKYHFGSVAPVKLRYLAHLLSFSCFILSSQAFAASLFRLTKIDLILRAHASKLVIQDQ